MTNCIHEFHNCNCRTETLPDVTLVDLQKAKEEAFQEGVKFAMAMMNDDTDFEPQGTMRVCFGGCYKTEFLTDAEAEAKGWSKDCCSECQPVDEGNAPYFQTTIGHASNAVAVKLGGITIR